MTIINDRENNKTIDTETNIFIEVIEERPNEQYFMFNIVDGEYIIYIGTQRISEKKEEFIKKTYRIFLLNNKIDIKYKSVIKKLLIGCQEYHGMISGVPMKFDVDFSPIENMFVNSDEVTK